MLRTVVPCLFLAGTPAVWSQGAQQVDLHELREYGALYLEKRVETPAVITGVEACAAQSNRGSTCIHISQNATSEVVIAPRGRVSNEELIKWSKDATPVLVSGRIEQRDRLSFGGTVTQAPALIVESIRQLPASFKLYAPLRPDWESLGVSTRGDRFFYDSREIEVANEELSVWMLVNFDGPQLSVSGRRFKSEISRLVYSCHGLLVTVVSESEYAESRGRGAQIDARVTSERTMLDLSDRSFLSKIYNTLKGLCR